MMHPISVKRCLHYRETVVQKHLAIGRGVKILDQKNRGRLNEPPPPAGLRVNNLKNENPYLSYSFRQHRENPFLKNKQTINIPLLTEFTRRSRYLKSLINKSAGAKKKEI